jgi:hypothetical protein
LNDELQYKLQKIQDSQIQLIPLKNYFIKIESIPMRDEDLAKLWKVEVCCWVYNGHGMILQRPNIFLRGNNGCCVMKQNSISYFGVCCLKVIRKKRKGFIFYW